ncbi:MAG: S41 family peptidase [Bacteroidales bacterium]|nr:S41 family peptidase [Bacteroidales bacterium]
MIKIGKKYLAILFILSLICPLTYGQVNPKEKFNAAFKVIKDNYVDKIDDEQMIDIAIKAILEKLDPHSKYFSREEAEKMKASVKGSFMGIGIQFVMQSDTVYVTHVFAGSPSEKNGIVSGDRILKINGESVSGVQMKNTDVLAKIRGEGNTSVELSIKNLKGKVIKKTVLRASVPDKSIVTSYMVDDKTGFILLRIFGMTTREELDEAIIQLKKEGMENLILDLQGNGGGLVEAAVGAADEFLKKDQLVYYRVGNNEQKDYYYTSGLGQFMSGRLVVLIDQYTASASEILTGALQDWDRAVVVGRRSFGKGLMQYPLPLFDGSVLQLTKARYYTPSGRSLQKPYKNVDYNSEINKRFASGEMQDEKYMKRNDSLKFTTLVNKRTVYGGGGVAPDCYIPIDTLEYGLWIQKVSAIGFIEKVSFEYVTKNRTSLGKAYPEIESYIKGFTLPENLVNNIFALTEKAGIQSDQKYRKEISDLLSINVKAQIAGFLYSGVSDEIKVRNLNDHVFIKALEIIESSEYTKLLNENNK